VNSQIRQSGNSSIITDQLGKQILLPSTPRRIISLVPSQTELLFDLGLDPEIIGITKFCVHPKEWFNTKARVGGTKNPDLFKIRLLQPQLVIANKEENNKDDIDEIEKFCPVWTGNISNRAEAFDMIKRIGGITGKTEQALLLIDSIKTQFDSIQPVKSYRCAYLIWKNPWMAVGGDCFIHDMLSACGFVNVFENRERYPTLEIQDLLLNNIEVLFLSSEPYPFKKKDLDDLSNILLYTKIRLVDGEFFSWYGSRMQKAPGYFKELINDLEKWGT
jgi:ABC-type Fe3+-hydroxamate transport system substrate-binding protein